MRSYSNLNFKDKKVTVMGLGLFGGGAEVAKFFVKQGAEVIVTDLKTEEELKKTVRQLKKMPIEFHLGGHRDEDFTDTDLIIVNPAVPKDSQFLKLAEKNHIPLETEMNLFFKLCPCKTIIGITGSNGKTTTTFLVGEILKTTKNRIWVGGNVGLSLLNKIEQMGEEDIVVLELSSFQLEDFDAIKKSPNISVITNLLPNHLDRHKTFENYENAKMNIIRYQGEDATTVINYDDENLKNWTSKIRGKIIFFSTERRLEEGFFLEGNKVFARFNDQENVAFEAEDLNILGKFNLQNAMAATAATWAVGGKAENIKKGVMSFKGVEHRLELVREIDGVKFFNDSIATTPESTIAALETLENIILIAGGYDKKIPLRTLCEKINEYAKVVILIGQTAGEIEKKLNKVDSKIEIIRSKSLKEAVYNSFNVAKKNDNVLLSPACASYDMFQNFVERGERFKKYVQDL